MKRKFKIPDYLWKNIPRLNEPKSFKVRWKKQDVDILEFLVETCMDFPDQRICHRQMTYFLRKHFPDRLNGITNDLFGVTVHQLGWLSLSYKLEEVYKVLDKIKERNTTTPFQDAMRVLVPNWKSSIRRDLLTGKKWKQVRCSCGQLFFGVTDDLCRRCAKIAKHARYDDFV